MPRLALPAVVPLALLALLLTGCAAPAPTDYDVSLEAPESEEAPAAEWTTFTAPNGSTFEHPVAWTVREDGVAFAVVDADGVTRLRYLPEVGGIGGPCEVFHPAEEIDSTELVVPGSTGRPPRVTYRGLEIDGRISASLGIAQWMEIENGRTCGFYNLVETTGMPFSFGTSLAMPESGDLAFDSWEEARAFVDTPDYATLERILTSFRLGG